jgi:hypothetical protein
VYAKNSKERTLLNKCAQLLNKKSPAYQYRTFDQKIDQSGFLSSRFKFGLYKKV